MGRRKISIAPIQDDRNRQVTFLKRKNGLFKKAYELGVLCKADVAVVVFNANGKLFEFHSGDMDQILLKYSHYAGPPHEKRGPEDYVNKDLAAARKGTGGKMTSTSNGDDGTGGGGDDDDDDEEDFDEDESFSRGGGAGGVMGSEAEGSSGVMTTAQANRAKATAAGEGSNGSGGKKVPEGKGKQALVAAKERERRAHSVNRGEGSSGERSLSREGSQTSLNGGARRESFGQNLGPPRLPLHPPPPSQQSTQQPPAGYPTFPLPSPNPPHHSQQQQPHNPYQNVGFPPNPFASIAPPGGQPQYPFSIPNHSNSMFPPPPPPPNPAELFSMGLFGPGPPTNHGQGGGGGMNPFGFPPNFGQPFSNGPGGGGNNGQPPGGGGGGGMGGYGGFPFAGMMPGLMGGNNGNNGGGGGSGGVPTWFGALNPSMAAQQQQQQQQHLHVQSHPSPEYQQMAQSLERPSSVASIASSSNHHQQQQHYTSPGQQQPQQLTSSPQPPHHGSGASRSERAPSRSDSVNSVSGSKPRLQVAIPPASNAEEGRKAGLVTAGGASILGKGIMGEPTRIDGEDRGGMDSDEDNQQTAHPRSAFASELLPSPFFPSHQDRQQNPYGFTQPPSNSYGWPPSQHSGSQPQETGYRPAPMLGEDEAPDLIRGDDDEGNGRGGLDGLSRAAEAIGRRTTEGDDGSSEVRNLKRGSIDLEDGMEGLEVVSQREGSGGASDEGGGGGGGGAKKRRA